MNSAKQVNELGAGWIAEGKTKTEIIINTAGAEVGWSYVWGTTGQECTPAKREACIKRISEAEAAVARKKCQVLRESNPRESCSGCKYYPDAATTLMDDCQGFVKQVCKRVGITFKGGGCSSMWRDDSNWSEKGTIDTLPERLCCVFWQDPKNKTVMSHIGFYIGGGTMIHCSGEVKKEALSKKCTHWAIPKGLDGDEPVSKPTLRKGSTGPYVVECQGDLLKLGYDLSPYGADGKYGDTTIREVKKFQSTHTGPDGKQLVADGVTGQKTWWALDQAIADLDPQPEPVKLYTVTVPHLTLEQAEELIAQYPGATKTEEVG